MNNIEQNSNSYHNAWRFIEDYLPNYSRRDDILMDDILYRYVEGEDVNDDDLKWIAAEFHSDKKLIEEELVKFESVFMAEALQAYYDTKLWHHA